MNNMRKIVLIIIVAFFSQIASAQQTKEYNAIIATIDSLIYAVQNHISVEVPHRDSLGFYDLSIDEQNKAIDHVLTLYNQTENDDLFSLARNLWVRFHDDRTDKTIQDRVARLYLDKAFYTFRESMTFLGRVEDYSEETRERLRNILEKNRTEEDIEARRNLALRDVKRNFGQERIDNEVERIMQITNRNDEETREFLTDSITNLRIKETIEFMEKYPPLGRGAILRIGSSNDLRFVAGLEKLLETADNYYSFIRLVHFRENDINRLKEAIIYALAKLGVQKYIDIVFAKESIIIYSGERNFHYAYLGTKEAFFRWLEINRDWNRFGSLTSISGSQLPAPILSLEKAQGYIQNEVPRELRIRIRDIEDFCIPDRQNCNAAQIENNKLIIERVDRLYQWFLDNKDNIELPPARDDLR
jgi:hypothetical protein